MDEDPFPAPAPGHPDSIPGYGLKPVQLADQALLASYFTSLSEPLSDYTFSQLYTWRNSLRILWKEIAGHLCVFANGSGDLTLLIPPVGSGAGGGDAALAECWRLMCDYNAEHGVPDRSRIEYVSEELLARFDRGRLDVRPMGNDYLYDVRRMIDLAGGDLASKRQAKNRFLRNYAHRVEPYDKARHLEGCCALLDAWKEHQDAARSPDGSTGALKRQKESIATRFALECADQLGIKGMVVYVGEEVGSGHWAVGSEERIRSTRHPALGTEHSPSAWAIRGFTFGEGLGAGQSSIVIEKTDLAVKGLAQFIFSEFCRAQWADRPLVNVGDDWGLETLAWTKTSYRPVKLLRKYAMTVRPAVSVAVPDVELRGAGVQPQEAVEAVERRGSAGAAIAFSHEAAVPAPVFRSARKEDLPAAVELEQKCYDAFSLSKRQLQYLQGRPSAVFLVAEEESRVVAEGIALVRRHRRGARNVSSGRIYSLAVASDARGPEIGHALLAQMIDELAQRGVRRVYLEVEPANAPAIGLYEALGFRRIGLLSDYYGGGKDALHMMREIPASAELFAEAAA